MNLWNPPKVGKLTDKSFQIPFSLGGAVAKTLAPKISRGATAQWNTIATYKKVNKLFNDLKKDNIHDFGSGLGIGTRQFKNKIVTSHEPFVSTEKILRHKPIKDKITGELFEGRLPNYKTIDEVFKFEKPNSKNGVVNLNVLNVIENKKERASLVKDIGKLLSNDGVGIITTRGDDVLKAAKNKDGSLKKNVKELADGFILGYGTKKQTFQKGFEQGELEKYVQSILGKNFKVQKIPTTYDIVTKSNPGVMITKLKEIKKFSMGGEVIDTSDLIGGVDSEFPVKKVSSDSVAENMYIKEMVEDDSYVDRDDEKKKDIQKTEKLPVYEDDKFLKYMKKVENEKLMLGEKNMMKHKSAEGGTDTVAYGHKLTKEEIESGKIYEYDIDKLTVPQANDILKRDLKAAHDKLIEIYGDEYLKLDNRKKQMLIDFQFNMGSGGVAKFKNFREGLFSGDEEKMKAEYERGYTKDGEFFKLEGRNKDFFNFFFK